MKNSLVKRVRNFPPLDETAMKIQELSHKTDSSIKELTEVVEKDPMLTANILKAANSPLYGFSREIKSIQQAVSLFGMATVEGFALASMMQNNIKMDLSPYNLNKDQFLNICLTQNALMYNWYSKVDRSMLEILMPASFLLEIGKIILSEELIDENKAKEFSQELPNRKTVLDIAQLEEDYLNTNSVETASAILEHWNLEPKIVQAIKYALEPQNAEDDIAKRYSIALNVVVNSVNINGKFTKEGLQEAYNTIEEYGLERDKFIRALEIVQG